MTTSPQDPSTRLMQQLAAASRRGEYRYHGLVDDGRRYLVELGPGRMRRYTTAGMWAWLRGRKLGAAAGARRPGPAQQRPDLDQIRRLFTDPELGDRLRLQIRSAMAAADMGVNAIADRSGRNRGTVREALRFGTTQTLSTTLAEQLIKAAGHKWADEIPPAPGLRRMRAALLADDERLVEWFDPLEPNAAYRAGTYTIVVPSGLTLHHHRVGGEVLVPWLVGIAEGRQAGDVADQINQWS